MLKLECLRIEEEFVGMSGRDCCIALYTALLCILRGIRVAYKYGKVGVDHQHAVIPLEVQNYT